MKPYPLVGLNHFTVHVHSIKSFLSPLIRTSHRLVVQRSAPPLRRAHMPGVEISGRGLLNDRAEGLTCVRGPAKYPAKISIGATIVQNARKTKREAQN